MGWWWALMVVGKVWSAGDTTALPHFPVYDLWRWRELTALSEISIRSMDQSPEGVLWLGGDHGLYRYDGYTISMLPFNESDEQVWSIVVVSEDEVHYLAETFWGRVFKGKNEILKPLPDAMVESSHLAVDHEGRVYLGTEDGMFRFSRKGMELVPIPLVQVNNVVCAADGTMWFSETGSGRLVVYRFRDDGSLDLEPIKVLESSYALAKLPFQLFPDSKGNVWVISEDPEIPPLYFSANYQEVVLDDLRTLGGTNIMSSITESRDGVIWISARRFIHRFANNKWEVLDSEFLEIPTSAPLLYTLNDGSLLVTGSRDKAMILNRDPDRFVGFEEMLFQVSARDGSQWFLSREGYLGRNSADGKVWTWFKSEDGIPELPSLVFESRDGTIWVAGSHQGSASVAHFDGRTWTRDLLPSMGYRIGHLSAFETRDGHVLFGNGSERNRPELWTGGLVNYTPQSDGGFTYGFETTPAVNYRVAGITEDATGTRFVSGPGFNRLGGSSSVAIPVPDVEYPGWWVDHMARGLGDEIWLCVWGKGVYRYADQRWEQFSESNGLVSNRSVFVLPSAFWSGTWVTTQKGILRFDGSRWTTVIDFPNPIRRESSTLVESADGGLWINFAPRSWFFRSEKDAAIEGQFRAIKYLPEKNPPKVALVVTPDSRRPEGDLYFEWSGSDFWGETPETGLEYSYRINEGAWTPFALRTQAVISNLKPDHYRFEVRTRDRDWNLSASSAQFAFSIIAPLWQRPWFIAVVVLTVGLIVFLVTLVIRNRIRHILEVEELKIQFFTYLSHELRTPLAVVLGPIESAMKLVESSVVLEKLTLAKKNANRVLSLVDQLLDFRKFEYGKKFFNPQGSNLQVFLRDAVESIRSLSEEKEQHLEFSSNIDSSFYAFDGDMLQKICNNLIGNAVKYSPEGSQIVVQTEIETKALEGGLTESRLILTVTDDGPGIDPEAQSLVFLPFYRVNRDQSRGKGTGLGLALVKDLVDAWGGAIALESPVAEGKGTRFRVSLPVLAADPVTATPTLPMENQGDGGADQVKDLILIVDDDKDFRIFLESELKSRFRVMTAQDGQAALGIARDAMPSVILSDFHMPGMSGEKLCRSLKDDVETCHIPIILLTSDQSRETELAGIKSYADDFVRKPLNLDLLMARLVGILATRQRLREQFSKQLEIKPNEIAVTSTDERLLSKAIAVVEANMDDDTFGVEEFSKEMAMSSRTLYRKLGAITGVSPSQFIRSIRLKRAAQLFQKGITVVSDVMVQVGILDASYFSRTFKKEFGKSPREYLADYETR
jgi:signal transduction histidine kinase/CheY-like chemotaxis protein/AraC-like DNA-binding protein